jgi:hypothetical protein
MKSDQSFNYTGSSNIELNNIELGESKVALFDTFTGIGGIDYMPYDGSTVTVKTGLVGVDPNVKSLEPSLNNKVYYLVTNELYDQSQKDLIISQATEIPVSLVGGRYEGTFVFSNPNDYDNLYLIWDYTDNLNSGIASYSGDATTRYIDIDFGIDKGIAEVSYETIGAPTRYILTYNGGIIADTGYIGLNTSANLNALLAEGIPSEDIKLVSPYDGLVDNGTGNFVFKKFLETGEAQLEVYAPLPSSSYKVTRTLPYLKPFYIDPSEADINTVCGLVASSPVYFNGSGLLPTTGDTIYIDPIGSNVFIGSNAFFLISDVPMSFPAVSGAVYVVVNSLGVCVSSGSCDCFEYSVPFIYQDDITLIQGRNVTIPILASGSPTSWSIITPCNNYELTGGTGGSLFGYTDCYGRNKHITVGVSDLPTIVCGTSVTLLNGDGTSTNTSACSTEILPKGLSLELSTGTLSGTPEEACVFPMELVATNCVGDSASKIININIETGIQLTPFAIDVENFGDTGDAACAVSPIYSLLYHNGINRIPDVNDTIYTDHKGKEVFMGGGQWYHIDHSTYSIKICETGNVCDKNECPTVTTTTTSTTTTTTTTTLPSGDWFEATLCPSGTVTEVLVDTTTYGLVVGDYVKTQDGNCWEITSVTTPSYPYQLIENPVVTYTGCNDCLGITTTTTTTTTTTAPTYTAFSIGDPYSNNYDSCSAAVTTQTIYHNGVGSYPVAGDFIFSDSLGTIPFNGGSNWYYLTVLGSDLSMQIAVTGQVISVVNCAMITTTTTTTTIPTNYYVARICGGGPFTIAQQSFSIIPNNTVVKCDDGNCYTIQNTGSFVASPPLILFTYASCFDCTGITTTTTTNITTTTTGTTTTSTTTTTTLPPLTSVFARFGNSSSVCNDSIVEVFLDGAMGIIGNKMYKYYLGNYIFADHGYYRQLTSSVAYEWDGNDYTGNTVICS